jgi:glycosyltransferase involved in cell wall biosynthesis
MIDALGGAFRYPFAYGYACVGGVENSRRSEARAAALCVANWLPDKGILELLDAAAALPPGTLRLHLAGDARTDTACGQRVLGRLGRLADRVVRHGPCDDAEVGHLYRSADLFVLPSGWETYGRPSQKRWTLASQ